MNKQLVKIILLFIFYTILYTGCELFKNESIAPGISIYKTRGDYFDLVTIGMKGEIIFRRSSFSLDKYRFIFSDTDTIYKFRIRLINGYILSFEADEKYDVFLDLTFKQHILLEKKTGHNTLSDDTLVNHILDKNPYIEFYRDKADPRRFSNIPENVDTSEINKIIKDGKIEQYFTRIK
jgi:hypothetical protein